MFIVEHPSMIASTHQANVLAAASTCFNIFHAHIVPVFYLLVLLIPIQKKNVGGVFNWK